jgi:dynein heavy chain
MPSSEIVRSIYVAMVDGHLSQKFTPEVAKLSAKLVDATVELHRMVSSFFLTSAVKFHYQFNLRDLSAIVQGLCRMLPEYHTKPGDAVRLWVHETERVFLDRMINTTDMGLFCDMRKVVTRKFFDDPELQEAAEKAPNVHTSFMKFTPEENPVYYGCDDYTKLNKVCGLRAPAA